MTKPARSDAKESSLKGQGSLHRSPESVQDPLFQDSHFFDPRDLVQVKYEMLRRVSVDGQSVAQAARAFGFSRPSYYQAARAYTDGGLVGLLPAKKGPRRAHKLSAEVVSYLREKLQQDPSLKAPALVSMLEEDLDLSVHPRSVERALQRAGKKKR